MSVTDQGFHVFSCSPKSATHLQPYVKAHDTMPRIHRWEGKDELFALAIFRCFVWFFSGWKEEKSDLSFSKITKR